MRRTNAKLATENFIDQWRDLNRPGFPESVLVESRLVEARLRMFAASCDEKSENERSSGCSRLRRDHLAGFDQP